MALKARPPPGTGNGTRRHRHCSAGTLAGRPLTAAFEMYQYRKAETTRSWTGRGARFKDVPLIDFISQFVELRPMATGAIGLCPFHDDKVPSFGVNKKGNYWNCFAGCGGGDIISFWMKWKQCDFITAVNQLEEVLNGSSPDHSRGR